MFAELVYLQVTLGLLLLTGCHLCCNARNFYAAVGELYPLAIMDLLFWMIGAEDFGTNLVAYFLGKIAFYLVSGVDFLFCFYL